MDRVSIDELDDQGDGDFWTWQGQPFTGVAYITGPDGSLDLEWTFRDGLRWGSQRIWHRNGRLAESHYEVAGMPHGVHRMWRKDGRKLVVEFCEFGLVVRSRSWAEDGGIRDDYFIKSEPVPWYLEELHRRREKFGRQVDAEQIPEEYLRVSPDDWDELPTPAL